MRLISIGLLFSISAFVFAGPPPSRRPRTGLSGAWLFFPDYPGKGEANGWHRPEADPAGWDNVEAPHIWNLEPRYEHTGAA